MFVWPMYSPVKLTDEQVRELSKYVVEKAQEREVRADQTIRIYHIWEKS